VKKQVENEISTQIRLLDVKLVNLRRDTNIDQFKQMLRDKADQKPVQE
jgi:hypothetical protein